MRSAEDRRDQDKGQRFRTPSLCYTQRSVTGVSAREDEPVLLSVSHTEVLPVSH